VDDRRRCVTGDDRTKRAWMRISYHLLIIKIINILLHIRVSNYILVDTHHNTPKCNMSMSTHYETYREI
jgi:hypothetical protein